MNTPVDEEFIGNLYVYIPSYQSVFLFLHLLQNSNGKVIGIARTQNIKKLLASIDVPYLDFAFEGDADLKSIRNLLHQKKKILEWMSPIPPNSQLVIGYNSFDIPGFFLTARWSENKGTVLFKDLDPVRRVVDPFSKDIGNIRLFSFILQKLLISVFWGIRHLDIKKAIPFTIGIGKKFLEYYDIQPLTSVSEKFMTERISVCKRYAQSPNARILYIADHSQSLLPYIDKDQFDELITKISNQMAFKEHPRETQHGYINAVNWTPDFLPAEFFYPKVDIVMSVASASLFQAGSYSELTAVSLINLLHWRDLSAKKRISQTLKRGDITNCIQYPNTWEEIQSILTRKDR